MFTTAEAFNQQDDNEEDESFPFRLRVYVAMMAFNMTITIPISLYYCNKILHQSNNRIFHKRYPYLTIACVLSFLIIHLMFKPICDVPKFFDIDLGFDSKYIYPYFGYLPWALILVRGWYLFYDYKHGMHLVQSEWSSKLKESRLDVVNVMHTDTHWTAKYQSFLSGNSRFPIYFAIFWVVLADLLSVILMTFDYRVSDLVYASFSLVVVVGAVCIVINIQSVKDTLYIADELKLLAFVGLGVLILYITVSIMYHHADEWRPVAIYAGLTVYTVLETYISTKWVIDQFHKRQRRNTVSKQSQNDVKVTLSALLQSKQGFEAFAAHLVHEFCIENLLFLFEAMHFKMQCLKSGLIRYRYAGVVIEFDAEILNLDDEPSPTHRRKLSHPRPPPPDPMKEKLKITNMDEFYANFHCIVDRYIHEHSEYSINISYETRRQFFSLIHSLSKHNESTSRISQLLNGTLNALKKKLSSNHSNNHHHHHHHHHHRGNTTRPKRVMSNTRTEGECKSEEEISDPPPAEVLNPSPSQSTAPSLTDPSDHDVPDFYVEEQSETTSRPQIEAVYSSTSTAPPPLRGSPQSQSVSTVSNAHSTPKSNPAFRLERSNTCRRAEEVECKKVIDVMDVAVNEVFRLLSSDIFPRFCKTDAFHVLNDAMDVVIA